MPSSPAIVNCSTNIAKKGVTGPVRCPTCGTCLHVSPHGTYERSLPDDTEKVLVKRFLCRDTTCSRKTFSILPYPCLRYIRHTLAILAGIAKESVTTSVKELARQYDKKWAAMRRLARASQQVWSSFLGERDRQPWGPCPCHSPELSWTSFTQDLYHLTIPGPS